MMTSTTRPVVLFYWMQPNKCTISSPWIPSMQLYANLQNCAWKGQEKGWHNNKWRISASSNGETVCISPSSANVQHHRSSQPTAPSVDHQHRQKQKGLSSVVVQPIMTRTPLLPMSFLWPISAFCLAQVSNSFAPRQSAIRNHIQQWHYITHQYNKDLSIYFCFINRQIFLFINILWK